MKSSHSIHFLNLNRNNFILWIALLTLSLEIPLSHATTTTPYIPVGVARTRKTTLAFPGMRSVDSRTATLAQTLSQTIQNDLLFMDLFQFLTSSAYIEDSSKAGIALGTFKMTDWSTIGAEFLLKTSLGMEGSNLALEAHLFDTHASKEILNKRFVAEIRDAKTVGHTLANQIVELLTGLPGIFLTKIAMVCDRTGKKEIYLMNFDGTDVKQVTRHRSISFAPAWSPDGTRIAYSLFNRHKGNIKNIDLYEFDFRTESIRLLSNRKGINSGAAYSPDGKKIALTMSFLGNPEIFTLDPSSNTVTRITKSFGFDVDPAWAPDGKSLAFVSSRSGMPMVYKTSSDGSKVDRLTYAGRYNATPSWSLQNNKIAFAGWIDGRFDIFIMNTDGTHIERLTKNMGNNEDPSFSPDGNFITYSSNRTNQQNIYVMNIDGTFQKRLTYGLGNCVAPRWSNPPK